MTLTFIAIGLIIVVVLALSTASIGIAPTAVSMPTIPTPVVVGVVEHTSELVSVLRSVDTLVWETIGAVDASLATPDAEFVISYVIEGVGETLARDHADKRHGKDASIAREVIQRGGPDKWARCPDKGREVLGSFFTDGNTGRAMFAVVVRGLVSGHELTAFIINADQVNNYWANILKMYMCSDWPPSAGAATSH